MWSYYTRENLCTGPLYDLDLITIGNLNQVTTNATALTTTTTSTSSTTNSHNNNNNSTNNNGLVKAVNDDDVWYPVPIQSAIDYYEQLDPLLPTQYELLLKQLMRMQPPPVAPSTPSSEPIGWKQVWDCFYDMAETKLINEMETTVAANGLTPEDLRF